VLERRVIIFYRIYDASIEYREWVVSSRVYLGVSADNDGSYIVVADFIEDVVSVLIVEWSHNDLNIEG
jgi:hypothetical protein